MLKTRTIRKSITMKNLFNILNISSEENSQYNPIFPIRVNTPYGFKSIASLFRTHKQNSVRLYFSDNSTLKCGMEHLLKVNGEWKKVQDITGADIIESQNGTTKIIKRVVDEKIKPLYDISVDDVHCYYSNTVLSHNSYCLAVMGKHAVMQGKKVLHVTLELNEEYLGQRYASIFTGIEPGAIYKHEQKIIDIAEALPGDLVIKYHPARMITANTIMADIKHLEHIDFKPELLIVDYADLMRSTEAGEKRYQDQGIVYEELRGLAGELEIPCWTASQVQRAGMNDEIIEADKIAESYAKIMGSDFVFSISRKLSDKLAKTARVHVIKNRFGTDGVTFGAEADFERGAFNVYDNDSPEGIHINEKMKAGETVVKDAITSKFKEFKNRTKERLEED